MKTALVVGSGAGGCAVAEKLSEQFNVVVLEAGTSFSPFSYKLGTLEPLRRAGLFLDERMISFLFPEMRILKTREGLVHVNGSCVGGTTKLATGNALRYDGALAALGVNLDEEFEELEQIVPISCDHYKQWSNHTVQLFSIFEDQGLNPQVTPKFLTQAERCVGCGHCVLGCRFGAKWTADALINRHSRISLKPGHTVGRVVVQNGRATGVEVRVGTKKSIWEADLVVLAAGGLGTPLILNASGISTQPRLFVDPVICIAAPWEQASLDAQIPMPFVSQRNEYILSPYFDWLSFFFNKSWRMPSNNIVSIMVKYADSCEGSYSKRGLVKPITTHDQNIIKESVEEAKQILDELGIARSDMFLGTLNAGHPGGCLPLTPTEAQTLHYEQLPENLYVADASLLPQSMGNPPILTIMALARRVARRCIEVCA